MDTRSCLSFEEIKRNFDKAFSYTVIEDRRRAGDETPVFKVRRIAIPTFQSNDLEALDRLE